MSSRRDGPPATSPRRIQTALRRRQAIEMRLAGVPVPEIAERLRYTSTGAVYQDIGRALVAYVAEPAEELRALELARMDQTLMRLDEREARVLEVRDRPHWTVSNGHVVTVTVRNPDTGVETVEPLADDGPVLAATAQLMAIEKQRADVQARRAKLIGLNAPEKHEVFTIDQIDAELARLDAEIAMRADADAQPAEG